MRISPGVRRSRPTQDDLSIDCVSRAQIADQPACGPRLRPWRIGFCGVPNSTEGNDAALQQLATHDARKAQVVELRFFGGLSMIQTADTLGVSLRTVESDWAFARAWLFHTLADERLS
jgi:DNA-directed RNA polymerase specialized sigma24 family protein